MYDTEELLEQKSGPYIAEVRSILIQHGVSRSECEEVTDNIYHHLLCVVEEYIKICSPEFAVEHALNKLAPAHSYAAYYSEYLVNSSSRY